jgi:hypothetical protein
MSHEKNIQDNRCWFLSRYMGVQADKVRITESAVCVCVCEAHWKVGSTLKIQERFESVPALVHLTAGNQVPLCYIHSPSAT